MGQNARTPHVRDTLAEIERMWNRLAVEAEVSESMLTRFLEDTAFGPDEIAIMVMAYEMGLTQIDASGHNAPTAETLAQTIVMLAKGVSAILFGSSREPLRSCRAGRRASIGPHRGPTGRSSSSELCFTSNEVLNSTSPAKMPLKLRPTGIGSGIEQRPARTTPSTPASGRSVARRSR